MACFCIAACKATFCLIRDTVSVLLNSSMKNGFIHGNNRLDSAAVRSTAPWSTWPDVSNTKGMKQCPAAVTADECLRYLLVALTKSPFSNRGSKRMDDAEIHGHMRVGGVFDVRSS